MYFGYFDLFLVGALILLNIFFIKKKVNTNPGCLAGALMYGIIFPALSVAFEIERIKASSGNIVDSFEVLYTYLRFPLYWGVGLLQLTVFVIRSKMRNKKLP